jgi:hypothetical protein
MSAMQHQTTLPQLISFTAVGCPSEGGVAATVQLRRVVNFCANTQSFLTEELPVIAPNNGAPATSSREQPFKQCFNAAMNGTSPGNGVMVTATGASGVGLIYPNPVSAGIASVNTLFNLARIIPSALVCSSPDVYLDPSAPAGCVYQ